MSKKRKKKKTYLRNVNEVSNTNLKKKINKYKYIYIIFNSRIYDNTKYMCVSASSSTILYLTDRNKGPFRIHSIFYTIQPHLK